MIDTEINSELFRFKYFSLEQNLCAMKVGTDGVLLGAWADVNESKNILDVGTGSGLIALMLAQRNVDANVVAIDIDQNAALQATQNFEQSTFSNRLTAKLVSLQDFEENNTFDLIVSNPPFFTGGTFSGSTDRDSVRHTIKLSHSDLLRSVKKLLSADGKFCVVLPLIEGLRFIEMAATYSLSCTRMLEVYPREGKPIERMLLQFEKLVKPVEKKTLYLYQTEGKSMSEWTEDYKELTKDFYLNL